MQPCRAVDQPWRARDIGAYWPGCGGPEAPEYEAKSFLLTATPLVRIQGRLYVAAYSVANDVRQTSAAMTPTQESVAPSISTAAAPPLSALAHAAQSRPLLHTVLS